MAISSHNSLRVFVQATLLFSFFPFFLNPKQCWSSYFWKVSSYSYKLFLPKSNCPAHAVSLHALTAKRNKTATMATSQGNSKVVSSNWKYRQLLLAYFNQRQDCLCTMHAMPWKKDLIHVCFEQLESYEAPHTNTCQHDTCCCSVAGCSLLSSNKYQMF